MSYAQAKQNALTKLAKWLDERFREEITTAKWPASTPPIIRDIVDTGRFRDSQDVRVTAPGRNIQASWNVPYAADLHDGGVTTSGQRMKGRPWTELPLQEMEAKFNELFDAELKELRL